MSELTPALKPTLRMRTLALVLEGLKLFGIAITCLVIFGLAFLVSVRTGITIPARWFGLIVWTCFLAWVMLRQYRSEIRHIKFWATFLALLTIHVVAFVRILEAYPDWRMAWFPLVVVIEAPFMAFALAGTIDRKHRRWDRRLR